MYLVHVWLKLTWIMSVLWLNILVVGSTANIWHKLIHLLLQRWWYAHAIATRSAGGRWRRATAAATTALGSRAAMYIEQVCCKSYFHITVDQAQWHGSGKYMKCLNAESRFWFALRCNAEIANDVTNRIWLAPHTILYVFWLLTKPRYSHSSRANYVTLHQCTGRRREASALAAPASAIRRHNYFFVLQIVFLFFRWF